MNNLSLNTTTALLICFISSLICFKFYAQDLIIPIYVDTTEEKKELNNNTRFEIGISTHEMTISYPVTPIHSTAQYESALSIHVGYQYINNYFNVGGLVKKGFYHHFDQPPGSSNTRALSYPWILSGNGGFNLFFKNKKEFALGPTLNYTILFDSKHNYFSNLIGIGGYIRKKWFILRIVVHKSLYTRNDHFNITSERSAARTIGLIIPISKVIKK